MRKRERGRGSKYTDDFKRHLVGESRSNNVTGPIISKPHGAPTSRISSWRRDQFKVISWDGQGPCLFPKRLERGHSRTL